RGLQDRRLPLPERRRKFDEPRGISIAVCCVMKLIVQPGDGLASFLSAIRLAKKEIDLVIFRFDRPEIAKALDAAIRRGVVVRTLVAHTNRGGEKNLDRKSTRLNSSH